MKLNVLIGNSITIKDKPKPCILWTKNVEKNMDGETSKIFKDVERGGKA